MAVPERANSVSAPDEAPIDGRRMAAALRAAALPITLAVLTVTLVTLLVSVAATDRYRATARIVDATPSDTSGDGTNRLLTTSKPFVATPVVLAQAARGVPGETAASLADKVAAGVAADADVLDVTATDTSPRRAAEIANAVAQTYLQRRAASQRASIDRTRAALQTQLALLQANPATADQAGAVRSRLGQLVVEAANAGNDLQLAEAAWPPSSAYAPRPARNALIAFFASLLLAVFVVLIRERLRPRVGGPRELGRLAGVPVLASFPALGTARATARAERVEALGGRAPKALRAPLDALAARVRGSRSGRARPDGPTEDAVRTLLGSVLLELPPKRRHLLAVTSPHAGQGSTRVTAELARALARAGQPTLAVSTELGSPALAQALGVMPVPGLAEHLAELCRNGSLLLGVTAVPGYDGLNVLPAGGPAPDGVGLLRPGALEALLRALDDTDYRYVVVDAPGLLGSPEARLIAQRAQAVLLACPDRIEAEDLADARAALDRYGVGVLGAVTTAPGPVVASEPDATGPAGGRAELPPLERSPDAPPLPSGPAVNGTAELDLQPDDVIAGLDAAGRLLTAAELRVALGDPPPARLHSQLRRLVDLGEIVRSGSGTRGDPHVYGARDDA